MAKILFTGNRGYLGSRFPLIHGKDHTILGIDKQDVDILDGAALKDCFDSFGPDLVIHAAAVTDTAFSNSHPELTERINVEGAVNIAEEARRIGAKLIFISTE